MEHSLRTHRRSLLPVFITYFLDNFGLAIIYPIFTPLLLNPRHPILEASATYVERTILLGLLIGSFPLAQFFGAPLIGQFSDRFGRKKAFYITILGTAIGYTMTAFSILENAFPLLFISRFLTGLFAGNLTLCLASIADMSPDQHARTKNFGLIAAIGGMSFILAILFGGILSNPQYSSHFNPSLPFWITATLSYINFALMIILFRETHPTRISSGLNPFRGIQNLSVALRSPYLRILYLINFFFMLAWVTSMQFFPTSLIKIFQFSSNQITVSLMGVGLTWTIANLWINRYLSKRVYPAKTLLVCLLLLTICLFILCVASNSHLFFSIFYPAAIFASLCWTNGIATVSIKASSDMQGSILGINQSMSSIAAMAGPSLGGIIAGFGDRFLFLFTGICSLIAFSLLYKNKIYKH
ncbi:MAG: MFS transporter [Verrucomicrobia bacterium]|nr:MFS transporter [Verrucomicrobiota bacterium]